MAVDRYTELKISFRRIDAASGSYAVESSITGGADATTTFRMPLADRELEDAIAALADTRSAETATTRRAAIEMPRTVTAQQFGQTIADALLVGDLGALFESARAKGPVRLRLDMTSEPELLRVPWEFLRVDGVYLAGQGDSTVVRELATRKSPRSHYVGERIRMLGVIANPDGDLDVNGERDAVEASLKDYSDLIDIEWLPAASYQDLQRRLDPNKPFHILHFLGHGGYTDDGQSIIRLEDGRGGADLVAADAFAQLIAGHKSLQLVVLNSCEGARTATNDPFQGIATILMQQGISAVIAHQFAITDEAGHRFASSFYYWLIGRRYPVDAAVAEARKAIMNKHPVEFATPVLFLQPDVDELFRFAAAEPADRPASGRRAVIAAVAVVLVAAAIVVLALTRDGSETTITDTIDAAGTTVPVPATSPPETTAPAPATAGPATTAPPTDVPATPPPTDVPATPAPPPRAAPVDDDLTDGWVEETMLLQIPSGGEIVLEGMELFLAPATAPASCAQSGIRFSWQVQDPWPDPGGRLEVRRSIPFNERTELVAEGPSGSDVIAYCGSVVLRNLNLVATSVEIRYVSFTVA